MLTLVAGKKKKKKEKKKKRKKKKEKRKKKKEKRKIKKKRKIKGLWLFGSLRGSCYAWSACLYCCYPHFGL
jgi:cell division septal protein FtsQ